MMYMYLVFLLAFSTLGFVTTNIDFKRAAVAWRKTTGVVRRPSLMPIGVPGGEYIEGSRTVGVVRRPGLMPIGGPEGRYIAGSRTVGAVRTPDVMPLRGMRGGYIAGGRTVVAGKRDVDANKDHMKRYAFGHVSGHTGIHGDVYG